MAAVVRVRWVARPPTARFDTVSFLSDYGTTDEFVGVVKAVIRDLAPHVTVIDLTHEIPPHDIRAGSLALARSIQYVPAGVVLAVVDPGVGTSRRAVAVEVANGAGVIIAPDNGLIAPAVAMAGGPGRAISLTNTEYHLPAPGATFAGRDIFAPVAAHLCNGVAWESLGDEVAPAELVPGVIPVPRQEPAGLVAEVLWVDRFGNAQLNVGPEDLEGWGDVVRLSWGGEVHTAHLVATYDEIGPGAIGLVLDSYGLLAISLMRRSAAGELGLAAGDEVTLSAPSEGRDGGITVPVSLRGPGRPNG
jgi:S-adenosyl-L-methionine hydrolase (adenosine-forming)